MTEKGHARTFSIVDQSIFTPTAFTILPHSRGFTTSGRGNREAAECAGRRSAPLSRRDIAAQDRSGVFRDSLLRSHAFFCRSPESILANALINLLNCSDYLATNQGVVGSNPAGRAKIPADSEC